MEEGDLDEMDGDDEDGEEEGEEEIDDGAQAIEGDEDADEFYDVPDDDEIGTNIVSSYSV
jgi:hypothetical protein